MNLDLPPVIFGTSALGNLYQELAYPEKEKILNAIFAASPGKVLLDSAGKYGAGLALEVVGRYLREKRMDPSRLALSNKLAWFRTPLYAEEPSFEPGIWKALKNDAVQRISYRGILECWEQGCALLGSDYKPQLLSVHDPDEYLAQGDPAERAGRFQDILEAYRALEELKAKGLASAIGVGAKRWEAVREISGEVKLDWVMLALSFTVYTHRPELVAYMDELHRRGIRIINSAVFHSGFLSGGAHFDYRVPDENNPEDARLFSWRASFLEVCGRHGVSPAHACIQFSFLHPGVASVALNTGRPERVRENIDMVHKPLAGEFWRDLAERGLIDERFAKRSAQKR